MLANIYLHYVLDLWIREIARQFKSRMYLIRYCDDFIIGCTNGNDARIVWKMLQERLEKFGLEISQEKSRLIEFGKAAYARGKKKGGKLKTLDFLGFTHFMARGKKGGIKLGRKTAGKRMHRKLAALNEELKSLRSVLPFKELHKHVCQVLTGYYTYFGFAGNSRTLQNFRYIVERMWFKWLNRRSQKKSLDWVKFGKLLKKYPLPVPRIRKTYKWIHSASL